MEELFDILDENGNKTGKTKPRSAVHRDGDWHKAVHIWIVNDKNEVLLQKRSANKDSYPNMWDMSSAGHLSAGDDSLSGAVREIQEELGLTVSTEQLSLIGVRKKINYPSATFINAEFNDIYLLRLSVDLKEITIQKEEISDVKFVPLTTLAEMIKTNDPTLLVKMDAFETLLSGLKQ